jgi:hypothetical protein
MMQSQRGWLTRRLLPLTVAALLIALVAPITAQERQGPAKAGDTGALGLIPADAGYFSTMLRNKEQLDIIAHSNAWGELWDIPAIQKGWQFLKKEYTEEDGKLSGLRKGLELEDNQELLKFFIDAGSHEIFTFAGANWHQFTELMGMINTTSQFSQLAEMIQKGGPRPGGDPRAQARAILRSLAAHPELIAAPDVVIGFKLTEEKRVEKQLDRLEGAFKFLENFTDVLKDRVKKTAVDGSSFLTINLDGEMVPWNDVPINDLAEKEGEFDALVKKLKETKLTFSMGVRKGYFLFAVGSSADVVKQIGGAGKRLLDRDELKPVLAAASKPLTSISYVSAALRGAGAMAEKDVEGLMELARAGLGAAGISEAKRKAIFKDLETFKHEMTKERAAPGASVELSYLTGKGYESFTYDYTKASELDDSRPLTLTSHLGGSPILGAVARNKTSPDDYPTMVKALKMIYGHAEDIVMTKLDDDQKEMYKKVKKEALPLLERLDEITGKQLIPALSEGEGGVAIDAKWSSKQWHKALKTPSAMPMPEIAIVIGVKDAALLKKAAAGYRQLFNDAIAKARELSKKEEVPDIKWPEPKTKKAGDGEAELFYYDVPEEAGLDPQVAPTAGLSDKVLVLAPSNKMAERLLTNTPLTTEGTELTRKRGVASVVSFNWLALVDAAEPWVMFAITHAREGSDEDGKPDKDTKEILDQVKTGFRILKVFKGGTAVTYREGDTWVTHSESVFKDLGAR